MEKLRFEHKKKRQMNIKLITCELKTNIQLQLSIITMKKSQLKEKR
jgi:hypothetical protein